MVDGITSPLGGFRSPFGQGRSSSLSIVFPTLTFDVDDQPYDIGTTIQFADTQDDGTGIFEVTIAISDGTLTLSGVAGLTFTTGDGTADSLMVFEGTLAAINAACDNATIDGCSAGNVTLDIPFGNVTGGSTISEVFTMTVTDVSPNGAFYYDSTTDGVIKYNSKILTYGV